MSSVTVLAIIMILVLLAVIIWNKIPTPIVMLSIPFIFALLCGYGVKNTAAAILNQFNGTMATIGYMLLFSLIYFQMLTETGMFDTIIQAIMKVVGGKMNAFVVLVLTTVIALLVGLTTNIVAIYLIVFPVMIPLYKRFGIDRLAAVILAQTASCVFAFLPWNYTLTLGVASTGCDLNELSAAIIPWSLCLIPVVVLQWLYFTVQHRKKNGSLGLKAEDDVEQIREVKENPNARPQLFWVNIFVFAAVIVSLTVFALPSWLVFCGAAFITTVVNYRRDYGPIWNKAAAPFLNILTMLLAVSAYIAVFNYAPEGGSSMVASLAAWMISIVPGSMIRFTTVIFMVLLVGIVRIVPYQIVVAMYPMLVSIGANFGISAVMIVAPLVAFIGLGTGVSPMTSSTYVSTALAEVDINDLGKRGVVIMTASAIVATLLGTVFGVLPV